MEIEVFLIKCKRSYVYTDKYGGFEKSSKISGMCIYMDREKAIKIAEDFVRLKYIDSYEIVNGELSF